MTEHKPLIGISKKSLVNSPPRLQWLLLRLSNYNIELHWIPGKEIIFRNVRVDTEKSKEPMCDGLDLKIQNVYLNASSDKCVLLAAEIGKDEVLCALKNQIMKGWMPMRTECPKTLQEYWNYRDELSILDGLILKGTRIIIPDQCREDLLKQLHEGQFDTDQTKLGARDSIYLPGINKDIELLVKTCNKCQKNTKRNREDPVLAREIPMVPWTLLEMDLFTLDDHTFLLVVDVMSRFPVVRILNTESSRSVLNALKGIYCDFGLPKRVITDNGPCFKAVDYIKLHKKLDIKVKKSSAYNHQSVGTVERMVQTNR